MKHKKTGNINCVILNYNDADTTKELVRQIHDYTCLNQIVVVDNASTDGSLDHLQALKDDKVVVISAHDNGGYGAGNNLGVEYSVKISGVDYVVIANPDTAFTEECLQEMGGVLDRNVNVGVVAASMEDAVYGAQRNGWPLRGFVCELLSMGPICRRLFRPLLEYPNRYFEGKNSVYVDGVHGSMLMVRGEAFEACKGYDPQVFLYQEEAILARRMKACGYRTVLLLNQSYRHQHSVSIGKTYRSQMARQRLRHESVMYYFREYLHVRKWQIWAARYWFLGILIEIFLQSALGTLLKKVRHKRRG